jgi:hypothetical protein
MRRLKDRSLRRVSAVVDALESRTLFSTAVVLVGTSGPDNFVLSFDTGSGSYSFSGGTTSPASVSASSLSSVSITGGGGSDTLSIDGGSPTLLNDIGADGTSMTVEVTTGSTLNFDANEHLNSLTIDSGATATVLGNGARALLTNSLTIAGSADSWTGQLDLGNNSLIAHNGNVSTITNQVKSGFNNGQWNGEGIDSSAASSDSRSLTALGAIQNSANGTPSGTALYTSFASQTAVNTDVLVGYTFYGDANLSGHVDGTDYSRIDSAFIGGGSGWFNGDFNYDGVINGSDYTLIDNAFNTQSGSAKPTTLPAQPTGVTIIQTVTGEVDFQWNPAPDSSVTSYDVYTGTDPTFVPSTANQIATGVVKNGYSDLFDTDSSTTWYYKVTSVNSSGTQSLPSAPSGGVVMPASTSDDYQDASGGSVPPDDSYDVDYDGNLADEDSIISPDTTSDASHILVAFYGAGSTGAFGNIHFANSVAKLGGTLRSDKTPYRDWDSYGALQDLLPALDTNGDHIITSAEIATKNIAVMGYSWGCIEATNFTRVLSAPNAHLQGIRFTSGSPKNPTVTYSGGYNLQAAVPIKILLTIDPVTNAFGLSGLIKSTDGPKANVVNFTNYYETRGGTTAVERFSSMTGGIDLGADPNLTLGNFFSAAITGSMLNSAAQATTQTVVTTALANSTLYISYQNDGAEIIYGRLKGSQVQHDAMPFFLQTTAVNVVSAAW